MFNAEGYSAPILLEIDRIDPNPAGSVRAKYDTDRISEYAEVLDNLPPLLVVAGPGDTHWLADGYHRFKGHQLKRKKMVLCCVKRGSFEEAYRDACHANETHGLKTTSEDKRKRVLLALKHPVMKEWSQGKLAEVCGVDRKTVGNLDSRSTGENPQSTELPTVVGKDGRTYKRKPRKPKEETKPKETTQPTAPVAPEPEPTPDPEPEFEPVHDERKDAVDEMFAASNEVAESTKDSREAPPVDPPHQYVRLWPFNMPSSLDAIEGVMRDEMNKCPVESRNVFVLKISALVKTLRYELESLEREESTNG